MAIFIIKMNYFSKKISKAAADLKCSTLASGRSAAQLCQNRRDKNKRCNTRWCLFICMN